MSADDWIPCPFCNKKYQDEISELKSELKKAYEFMSAKEYDQLKARTRGKISSLEDEMEAKSYARIDGTGDYAFNENKELTITMGALCPHCNRVWQIDATAKPEPGRYSP